LEKFFFVVDVIIDMDGGTFFKVGVQVHLKKYITFLRFKLKTSVTSQVLKYDVITYTPWWRPNLHYFKRNYTTMKTYQWTTWYSKRLLQGRPRSTALLGLIIQCILSE